MLSWSTDNASSFIPAVKVVHDYWLFFIFHTATLFYDCYTYTTTWLLKVIDVHVNMELIKNTEHNSIFLVWLIVFLLIL